MCKIYSTFIEEGDVNNITATGHIKETMSLYVSRWKVFSQWNVLPWTPDKTQADSRIQMELIYMVQC